MMKRQKPQILNLKIIHEYMHTFPGAFSVERNEEIRMETEHSLTLNPPPQASHTLNINHKLVGSDPQS